MSQEAKDNLLKTLGMEVVSASADEVVLEWEVQPRHHQPMGIVHGGVHCAAVETVCSIGAGIAARERDPEATAVGLENQTSFIRAVREGRLRAVATPLTRGRRSQLWQAEIRDDQQRLVASGRVRLLVVSRREPIG
ncbi:MAG: PaaI family thioesterase [Myxococcales bacterium]|jgi:uncharacterized protein (TIGR00369 family)